MHQSLGRVPNDVADGFFWIDSEQMLEDVQEGNFLRGVHDVLVDGVKDVQVGRQVNVVWAVRLKIN